MRFLPTGPSALLVEVDDADVLPLVVELERRRAAGWTRAVDVVPGARTILFDGVADPAALAEELSTWELPTAAAAGGPVVEVTCRYGGPDLAWVAEHWGVPEDALPELHAGLDHRVKFCGFSPGFAYLEGIGEHRAVPRLETPRPVVEAGSVAVAGPFTGIYPRPSPGGWRVIGHTDADLWDLTRDPPALLTPGTTVRFVVA